MQETLIEKIKYTLNETGIECFNNKLSESGWTTAIKKALAELGVANDCKVCTGGFPNIYSGEWLYDLMWYKEKKIGDYDMLSTIPLIVESEWERKTLSIKYDFEKLLNSNAKLKLMICQSKPENIPNLLDYFETAVKNYELAQNGSQILIAILDDYDTGEFQYQLLTKEN